MLSICRTIPAYTSRSLAVLSVLILVGGDPTAVAEEDGGKTAITPASATERAKATPKTDTTSAHQNNRLKDPSSTDPNAATDDDPMQPIEDAAGREKPSPHRVEDVLRFAREGLQRIDEEVRDYTCTLVRRERINGEWPKYYQRIEAKVRHEQRVDDEVVQPFALFLEFRNPRRMEGRQVIYVEHKWHGDLIARRGGLRTPNMTVQLDPQSPLAMDGNRYPITEFGIRKLADKLIQFMENELDLEDCEVKVFKNAKLEGRPCTHFQVSEKTRRPDSRFRMARVLVDNEYKVPVYYAAFGWGATEEDTPVPLEEYAYINFQMNVGLTDLDFDIENPEYQFQTLDAVED
jgi:hypothetical protein